MRLYDAPLSTMNIRQLSAGAPDDSIISEEFFISVSVREVSSRVTLAAPESSVWSLTVFSFTGHEIFV